MSKFTVIRIAENGQGRLLRVSQHTNSLLAGKRAWVWLVTSTNPATKVAWAVDDEFELPDGSYKFVKVPIEGPDGDTVEITQLELVD